MIEWPLYGREAEVAHLSDLMDDADARGVALSGPAGTGKTRLAQECLRMAAERGMAVERISATYAASSLPLGAVLLARPPQDAIALSAGDQTEHLHRVANELIRQANGRRLVLLVDDVHWLDHLSALLIHQLVSRGAAFGVLTSRSGTVAPDPIVALWKDRTVERMSVNVLDRDAIGSLLTTVLGGPVGGAAIAELTARSEGNLLFLRELVAAALENRSLTLDSGVWRLTPGAGPQPRLVELVEHRLSGLDPESRDCLEVVAFGEPLELAHTVALVGEEPLHRMERQGLVTVVSDGWGGAKVTLGHPLVGEVLRAEATVMRARQITGMLADAAEARRPQQPDELLRLATWHLVCGGGSPASLQAAAMTAHARRDYGLTMRLAQGAIAAGAGLEAKLLLADARRNSGDGEEAERELAELASDARTPDEVAAIALVRLITAHLNGDMYVGLKVYRGALGSLDGPGWRARLSSQRAWLMLVQEGPRGALRATDEIWSDALDDFPFAAAAIVRAGYFSRSGRVEEALELARRGREAHERLTEPFSLHPVVQDFFACEALGVAGRLDEWVTLAQRGYDEGVRDCSGQAQQWSAYHLATANLARGRVTTAVRLAGEAVGIGHQIPDGNHLPAALARLAQALAHLGDVDGAAAALAELDHLPHNPWMLGLPTISHAWLCAARGDLVTARRTLEEEVERSLSWDDLYGASVALHTLVRFGDARIARHPLQDLAKRMEGDLVPTQARHAAAVVTRDGEGLETVAENYRSMSALLWAAEAYCDAAVAYQATDDPKRATSATQKAGLLLERCEGATTPATRAIGTRAELTQAERRTALLAVNGLSNKEIAAAEQVSVRTVDSRLQCVYTKLGISSRKDLRDALGLFA